MKKIILKLFCFSLIFACIFYATFSATNISTSYAENNALSQQTLSAEGETEQLGSLLQDGSTLTEQAPANGQSSNEGDSPKSVLVYGGGTVTAVPDVAYVDIGVESLNSDLQAAVEENDQIIVKIIDYLKQKGISEDDIKTKYYSIYQKHDYSASERFLGYQVSSTIEFKTKDLQNLGEQIKELTSLGANRLGGISFDCEDISSYYQQALKLAVEDAQKKANALSSSPLNIIRIVEENVYTCMPYRLSETSLSTSSSIIKGSMQIEAKIKVIFG